MAVGRYLMKVLMLGGLFCPLALAESQANKPKMLDEIYEGYKPDFAGAPPENLMKFSLQPTFYNRAHVEQDRRIIAHIGEGKKREAEGDYQEAIKHYQTVITKYPEGLVQVSESGVFVSAPLYVQHRILAFPPKELGYYRMLYDAETKEHYERGREQHSLEGLHDVADFFRATSYGAKALFELGSHALDGGHYEEAANYFEEIRERHPAVDYDAAELKLRLAYAYRRLGWEEKCSALLETPQLAKEKQRIEILRQLKPVPERGKGDFEQRKNPKCLSFSDYARFEPLQGHLSTDAHEWRVSLPIAGRQTSDDGPSKGQLLPFHHPWVAGNSLFYKHYNRIYCRSLITGELRWSFDLGPLEKEAAMFLGWGALGGTGKLTLLSAVWCSDQDILVDEALVFANVRVHRRRESLVALDQVTGEVRWTAGSMKPRTEKDLLTRYGGPPGLGRHAVYAPWSYDEGEGADHLYTVVGLTAFEKETGRVLWRRELCQLSPTATTQERRGIRVISATPLVHEGVVYHVSNAGVVAALDEVSGAVRWLARYPHDQRGRDAHDDVPFGYGGGPGAGPHFRDQPPLLKGDRLYVTPIDSDHFLCMDRHTGKVLWNTLLPECQYLIGMTRAGELILAGSRLGPGDHCDCKVEIREPERGKTLWRFEPAYRTTWGPDPDTPGHIYARGHYMSMRLLCRPTLTRDDKLYFSTFAAPDTGSGYYGGINPVYAEWCLSLSERKLLDQRIQYAPYYRMLQEGRIRRLIQNKKNYLPYLDQIQPQNVNTPYDYDPVKRMPFKMHGVLFEITSSGDSLAARFDRNELERAVAQGENVRELFTRAELLLLRGQEEKALAAFEECEKKVRPEDKELLRQVDRELHRLYKGRAWKARLAGDGASFHKHALRMAETATMADEVIQSLLVLSESFEQRGEIAGAVKCLSSVIRHFSGTVFDLPPTALVENQGERAALLDRTLALVSKEQPADLAREFALVTEMVKGAVPAYFSVVAPVKAEVKLEAETMAIGMLQGVLARNPKYREEFEASAAKALAAGDLKLREHEMKGYPGTKAAQVMLDGLVAQAEQMEPGQRQKRLWELSDAASTLLLKVPPKVTDAVRIVPVKTPRVPLPERFVEKSRPYEDGGQNQRLLLAAHGGSPEEEKLLFVGGREKKRVDNKFSLECWDLASWRQKWEVTNIRLEGKGDEPGFEEVFLAGPLVLTHGRMDVFAFTLAKGELAWRFVAPFDFDLRAVSRVGELLILSGTSHTLALRSSTGEVVWSAPEMGILYHAPFFREGLMIGVRREPFGVTFRRLGSGKLVRFLQMPDLDVETKHPVLAAEILQGAVPGGVTTEALPITCQGDLLMLTDGAYYIAVDINKMLIRWKRAIDNNDPMEVPPMRFFLQEPYLLVLKRDFMKPALYLLDSRTGELKWVKTEREAVYSVVFSEDGKAFYGLGIPSTTARSIILKGFATETGQETYAGEWTGFQEMPDAAIMMPFQGMRLVIRAIQGERMDLLATDPQARRELFRVGTKAVGERGVHGGRSFLVQGPHLILMNAEQVTAAVPQPEGK